MRIALNLLYLIPDVVGGTQTYATSLIRALAAIDRENEFVVFVNKESADLPIGHAANIQRIVCGVRGTRRPVRYAWEQAVLPFQLRSYRADLVHSLGYVGPIVTPCPHVVTIPDVHYMRQVTTAATRRLWLRLIVGRVVAAAEHIVTISNFSRNEIGSLLDISLAKITVTHLAARDDDGLPLGQEGGQKYGVRSPYVIAFSSASLYKNIPRLVAAFSRVAPVVPHTLVLVGHLPSGGEIQREIERSGLAHRVTLTGYVPDHEVMSLLRRADLFVMPSLYEGFGLPILDAQKAGVPVACSEAGALPEVAGEGATFFDPQSIDGMATALTRCLRDERQRAELVREGRANLQRFSWERTARRTLDVYRRFGRRTSGNAA